MRPYGSAPVDLGKIDCELKEVMYYLYLPVKMRDAPSVNFSHIPTNLHNLYTMLVDAQRYAQKVGRELLDDYVYVSARRGWATPDNPLNRPGWHCDGFGTDDLNLVWWKGAGTRFLTGNIEAEYIGEDHKQSIVRFERMAHCAIVPFPTESEMELARRYKLAVIDNSPEQHLYAIDPSVIHATPIIKTGQMRTYVKISFSRHRYNLENNSHNYLFNYDWPMEQREVVRNDTFKAGRDYT